MKYIYTVFFLIIISAAALPQNINGRFSSSVYLFERFDSADAGAAHARTFQMLSLNINEGDYSIRSSMNLEYDLSEDIEDDPRARLYNLYFEARNLLDIATVKLGRQPQFNSVIGGVFDGINLDLREGDFKLSGFYGGNVPAYQKFDITDDFWKDDFIYGGKFSTTALEDFRFDLSFLNKNFKPRSYKALRLDEGLNPMQIEIENKSNKYSFLSGEVYYEMENIFNVNTRYDYDLNFETTSKFEINGRYEEIDDLGINVYYNYREPKIRYNSIFSVFDFGNSSEIEIGGDYRLNEIFTVVGKFGNVTFRDESSQRVTAGVNSDYGTVSYRKTFGYAGELDAISLYTAHSFFEGLLTPSAGVSFTQYKLSEDADKNDLTSVLAGVNYRPFRILSFDIQGQYINNKIYRDDYRFFFKLNYWFNENL